MAAFRNILISYRQCDADGTRVRRGPLLFVALSRVVSAVASCAEFVAAPDRSAGGDGSIGRPWNLAKGVLAGETGIDASDISWLRGGRYRFPPGGKILC
jgi:hypothetical protein